MKRMIALLLCGLILLPLLAACANGTPEETEKPAETTAAPETEPETEPETAPETEPETAPPAVTELKEGAWNNSNTLKEAQKFSLPYQIYLPAGYTPEKSYPVLFYLHGNGSRGTNNTTQISNDSAEILKRIRANAAYKGEVIMIAPQCSTATQWVSCDYKVGNYTSTAKPAACLQTAIEIFDYWTAMLSTDPARYYLYGNSMGGFACWDLMARFPDRFAAAVIVAGCGDLAKAPLMKDLSIWIHHGTTDPTVPYSGNEKMYNALREAGAGENVILTPYNGKGHTIFKEVGASAAVLKWIFEQRKG